MPWTDGISSAFAALAGGDAIEARERARYSEALARRALTDQKVLGETARTKLAKESGQFSTHERTVTSVAETLRSV